MTESREDQVSEQRKRPLQGAAKHDSSAKLHELAALRLLGERLSWLEAQRKQAIAMGEHAPRVDREAAQFALTAVVEFFLDHGIEAEPLVRLLGELASRRLASKPAGATSGVSFSPCSQTSSSSGPGRSCPSASATGPMGSDQRKLVLGP